MGLREKASDSAEDIKGILQKHRFSLAVLFFVTVSMTFPAIISQGIYPSGVDTPAHIFKIEAMSTMLAEHGKLFQWSNSWYTGYPFLSLYAPVTYYLLLGFSMVLGDTILSFNIFRIFLLFFTGLFVYVIMQQENNSRKISLVAGVLAITAIPIHNNIFAVGRIPYAAGLIFYLISLYLLLQDEIYTTEVNRYHLGLAAALITLFVTHPMTAYFLALTSLVFPIVYPDKIRSLGVRPVLVVGGILAIFSLPYLSTFIRHSYLTDPFWIRSAVPSDLTLHITRNFENTRPRYLGLVHVGLLVIGFVSTLSDRARLKLMAVLNFGIFYTLFWSHNLGFLHLMPFSSQFDMPRFEVMFILWGVFVAAYGLKDILHTWELSSKQKKFLLAGLIGLILIDVAPLADSTRNWSPDFEVDQDIDIDDSYRAMMYGGRHWDDYILPVDFGVDDTFGWFQQADPQYNFSQTLQNTGGVWYPSDPDFPHKENTTLRKNLMQLSNTKYLIFGKEGWTGESKTYTLGEHYPTEHRMNQEVYEQTDTDSEFERIHNSDTLDIFELERDMSYCRAVEPVWVEDNYFKEARSLLSTENIFPSVPVNHQKTLQGQEYDVNTTVNCSSSSPTAINVKTDKAAWILVKESYYPYWTRSNQKPIYNAFGFIVTHVNNTGKLVYDTERPAERSNTIRS